MTLQKSKFGANLSQLKNQPIRGRIINLRSAELTAPLQLLFQGQSLFEPL